MSMWLAALPFTHPADDVTQYALVKGWMKHQCSVSSVTATFIQEGCIMALKRPSSQAIDSISNIESLTGSGVLHASPISYTENQKIW